jgi:hypothetical protein
VAGETSTRQWWLIVRRDGFVSTKTRIRMPTTANQTDLDPLVDPIPISDDADLLDDATILPTADQNKAYSYEVVAVTSISDINEVD